MKYSGRVFVYFFYVNLSFTIRNTFEQQADKIVFT